MLQHVHNQRAVIQLMPGGSLQPVEATISQFLDYHAAASVGSKDTKKGLTRLLQVRAVAVEVVLVGCC